MGLVLRSTGSIFLASAGFVLMTSLVATDWLYACAAAKALLATNCQPVPSKKAIYPVASKL